MNSGMMMMMMMYFSFFAARILPDSFLIEVDVYYQC